MIARAITGDTKAIKTSSTKQTRVATAASTTIIQIEPRTTRIAREVAAMSPPAEPMLRTSTTRVVDIPVRAATTTTNSIRTTLSTLAATKGTQTTVDPTVADRLIKGTWSRDILTGASSPEVGLTSTSANKNQLRTTILTLEPRDQPLTLSTRQALRVIRAPRIT